MFAAAILVGATLSSAGLFLRFSPGDRPSVVLATAFAFLLASIGLFFWPRLSYCFGLISGLVILQWYSRFEFSMPGLNTWITFNLPNTTPEFLDDVLSAKVKILFVVTVVSSTVVCMFRLLPAAWMLKGIPIRERTWPSIAFCLLVVASWYCTSVSPYRIPLIVDGTQPELVILHVNKKGRVFRETAVRVFRDGRFFIGSNYRRLFHYRFEDSVTSGVLPEPFTARVRALTQSGELTGIRTGPAVPLRARNAEGWYVRTRQGILAFSTEYGTWPPLEVTDMFHRLESVEPSEKRLGTQSDVCFGFCYDPLAGMGIVYLNDRCGGQNGTGCK